MLDNLVGHCRAETAHGAQRRRLAMRAGAAPQPQLHEARFPCTTCRLPRRWKCKTAGRQAGRQAGGLAAGQPTRLGHSREDGLKVELQGAGRRGRQQGARRRQGQSCLREAAQARRRGEGAAGRRAWRHGRAGRVRQGGSAGGRGCPPTACRRPEALRPARTLLHTPAGREEGGRQAGGQAERAW